MELKKGYLLIRSKQNECSFDVSIDSDGNICDDNEEFYKYYQSLNGEQQEAVTKYFSNTNIQCREEVESILFEFVKDKLLKARKGVWILYEEVVDVDGNKYGKEYLTDRLFPIPNKITGDVKGKSKTKQKKGFFGVKKGSPSEGLKRFYVYGRDRLRYLKFIDNSSNVYYSRVKTISKGDGHFGLYDSFDDSCGDECDTIRKEKYRVYERDVTTYRVKIGVKFNHENMNRLEVALLKDHEEYANDRDVSRYRGMENWNNGLSSRFRKLSGYNNFKKDVIEDDPNKKRNSKMLDLINDIETVLLRIKIVNIPLYEELYGEYQSIINEDNLVETDKYKKLEKFYNNMKDSFMLSNDGEKALELLDKYINIMIQDIRNKTYSGVSIEYLTEMHSEFLNNEDKYDFKYVQKINSRLNILYFLYVYNRKLFDGNLDNISKSYIPSCIKGIINVSQALYNIGVIEFPGKVANLYNTLTYKDEYNNLDWLFEFMDYVKFKDVEKVKELIK